MSLEDTLLKRSGSKCELCEKGETLSVYEIPPVRNQGENSSLMLCSACRTQIEDPLKLDPEHWECLQSCMWSEHIPVQVMAYRMLSAFKNESWAMELLEQLYLDDELVAWAKEGVPQVESSEGSADVGNPTLDSNGSRLQEGDSVTLIKDLDVKGGGFTAKRGTLVKGITLTDNPLHVEGRVNGVQIVLVAKFLKKVIV